MPAIETGRPPVGRAIYAGDGARHSDDEGTELPNRAAARKAAIRHAGDVLAHEPDVLWDGRDFRVEATDDKGLLLFTVICFAVDAAAADGKA